MVSLCSFEIISKVVLALACTLLAKRRDFLALTKSHLAANPACFSCSSKTIQIEQKIQAFCAIKSDGDGGPLILNSILLLNLSWKTLCSFRKNSDHNMVAF